MHFCRMPETLANQLDHPVCFPQTHTGIVSHTGLMGLRARADGRLHRSLGRRSGTGGYVFWDVSILPPDYVYEDYYAQRADTEEGQSGPQLETPPASGSGTNDTRKGQAGTADVAESGDRTDMGR